MSTITAIEATRVRHLPVAQGQLQQGFLEQTRQAARQLMTEASAALSADDIARIRRLAVLEDLAPLREEYERWKKVLNTASLFTPLLFNGLPGIGMFFLYVFLLS
jgi:hypothetical protein